MSKMRVMQVTQPNGPFELVEREIPEPGDGQVRLKVEACGICHSDSLTREGTWPGVQYPRVPGHEVAGIIDAVGAGVVGWTAGQRVGVCLCVKYPFYFRQGYALPSSRRSLARD